MQSLPHKETIPQIFEIFRREKKMRVKYLVVTHDFKETDNWYSPADKLWVITAKALIDILRQTFQKQCVDSTSFENYLKNYDLG